MEKKNKLITFNNRDDFFWVFCTDDLNSWTEMRYDLLFETKDI